MKAKEKGITLLALVVTIIIMLILAGVTLNAALGDRGVIKEAQETVNEYGKEQEEENEDLEKLRNAIATNKRKRENRTVNGETTNITNGTNNDDVTPTAKTNIIIKDKAFSQIPDDELSNYYGEKVIGFNPIESVKTNLENLGIEWQLFYEDSKNIYLITSDYVPVSTLPSELNKESGVATQKYKAGFASTTDGTKYTGPIIQLQPWNNGSASSTITGNELTSKYLKWVEANPICTNANMQGVAYMMDTSKWSNFAGNEITGAKAMGGPTLEMFIKSYNAKHDTKISIYEDEEGNSTINTTNSNQFGYKVKWESNTTWEYSISNLDASSDNMWVKIGTTKANALWLASPSAFTGYSTLSCVNSSGGIGYCNAYAGLLRL